MASKKPTPLVAVDIGNSRTKIGVFEHPFAEPLPHPTRAVSLPPDWTDSDILAIFPDGPANYDWWIASVNRPQETRLLDWLKQARVSRVRQMEHTDLPLVAEVAHPDRVGIDRLATAVAANRLRQPDSPAVLVGIGTALVIDLVSATGSFLGGAILPGLGTSARALHEFTDLLPLVEIGEPPEALGTSTIDAIRSGLYWGMVGAVHELVAQLVPEGPPPEVFLTGGAGPLFAEVLRTESERPVQFVPHLTLAGIALGAIATAPPEGLR